MKYTKAIRDRIPEIIREFGEDCKVEILDDAVFLEEMEKKLREEVEEYLSSKSPVELADVIEVIYRIVELRKMSLEELDQIRLEKKEKRGGFKKNLFLVEIYS